MEKGQLKRKKPEKACFGTREWSENSGICNGCALKKSCGEIKASKE